MNRSILVAFSVCSLAASCSSDDENAADMNLAAYDCAVDTRDDEYVAGIEEVGSADYSFQLVDAVPAPPDRGDNAWVLVLSDRDGEPVKGATLTVTPFMPDHGHGSHSLPEVIEQSTPGEYSIEGIDFFMPGYWETTVEASIDDKSLDTAVFKFCARG